ncbi:uncharacterized protein M421DRAFT_420191 [Didymella exigua CBS 183.55]|uniref:Ribosomal protein bL31m N-terminal domain-containing protein n=1 Tax=Didymella exigua CBS 183.55 TaxID=1150837 RepID=A0A6A5RNE5_9PLEO|nr:uncharacterized protein M421DRAFT_420191 [Didymella exigua CBS 183.55]KAF1928963.1 hypothetical protein M421DRAFT_420191 [Didymella exigua CBS 183.55]
MAAPIPSSSALRVLRASILPYTRHSQQVRHATLLRRPKRPYTFTQLVQLSDGSAFTLRTTNPQPVLKTAKDIRNNPLWHPSTQKLLSVEEDEAGRLAAFRAKFGTAWDSEGEKSKKGDSLLDIIGGAAKQTDAPKAPPKAAPAAPSSAAKPAPKK